MLVAAQAVSAGPVFAGTSTGTSVTILYAPASPIVANTPAAFTAHITPFAAGRTISWYVNGGLAGQSTTNSNGIAAIGLTFGSGGYGIKAVLEPVAGLDRAESDEYLLAVTQDPSRLPDRFFAEQLEHPTLATQGAAAQISLNRAAVSMTSMWITATNTDTNQALNLVLQAPAGSTLVPGVYTSDASNLWLASGCGSGSVTRFDIFSMERDSAGVPISFALTFEFLCNADQTWPIVGAIRYNATTPIPSLSLPVGSPVFDSVIEGEQGAPRTFSMTNGGDATVSIGTIVLDGPDAAAFAIATDACSGADLAAGETCDFAVRFTPSSAGGKYAGLVIPSSLGLSPRHLAIRGQALIAETVGQPVVAGELQYFTPGITYSATITPNPQVNFSECIVDGSPIDGSISDSNGVIRCITPRPSAGEHTVSVHYLGSVFHGEASSPTTTFTVDPTSATTVTASLAVANAAWPIKIDAAVAFHGDVAYDGGTLTITDTTLDEVIASGPVGPSGSSISVTRTFSVGAHHFVAEYGGTTGEDPSSASADLEISPAAADATPPIVTAPTWSLIPGIGLDAGRPKLRIVWSGSDDRSGIDHFEVAQSTDGGAFVTISAPVTHSTLNRLVALGHRYRFRVRAIDVAGNVGAWAYGPTSRISGISQSAAAIHYHGSWSTSTGSSMWWGGSARSSSVAGSTVSWTFNGRSIAWVGVRAPNRGKARISINGVLMGTVDLWLVTVHKQNVLWQTTWSTATTRTITIEVRAAPGRPRVDVDGFIVGS